MNPARSRIWRAVSMTCVMSAVAASSVAGQDITSLIPSDQDTVAADTVVQPTAIPFDAVPIVADQTEDELRGMASTFAPTARVATIEDELIDEIADLNRRREELASVDLSSLPHRRLADLRFGWRVADERLTAWKRELRNRWSELQDTYERLKVLRSTWELTSQVAESEPYPEDARRRIRFVLGEIEQVDDEVRDRFSTILSLQNQVAEQERTLADVLDMFRQLGAVSGGRVLIRDAPPIWRMAESGASAWAFTRDALDSARDRFAAFDEFVSVSRGDLWFVMALFVVLLAGMLALQGKIEAWSGEDEGAIGAYRHVLLRPFSSAFLLSLFIAGFFVEGPYIWGDLLTLLAAVPVLRLIPGLVPVRLRPPLYGLVGLFVIDRLDDIAFEGSGIHRLGLLFTAVAGAALITWFLRNRDFMAWLRQRSIGKLAIIAGRVAVILFAISFVANVLGWVQLGELLNDGVYTSVMVAVATAAAAIILIGLVQLFPQTRMGHSLRGVRRHGDLITTRLTRLIRWLAVVAWAWSTLHAFGLWTPMLEWLGRTLGRSFSVGFFSISASDVILFVMILWTATLASRFIRFVLMEDILPRLDLRRGVATTVSTLVHWTILGVGLLAAVSAAGIGSGQLTVVAGALGVGIGFGLQGIVNNFVSGLVLIFEQPIKVADTIQVGTLLGEVRRIGVRASVIRTFDGAEVIVPNANLVAGEVINWTLSDQKRRVEILVGVRYGTDPKHVIDLLVGVASDHKEVMPYPAPQALLLEFGESSLNFSLRAWTAHFEDHFRVKSELTVQVDAALKGADIGIPYPQRDLHLRSSSLAIEGTVEPIAQADVQSDPEVSRDDA